MSEAWWKDEPRCPQCHDWLFFNGRCPNECQPAVIPGKAHPPVWPEGKNRKTMLAEQDGKCAICHRREDGCTFVVDHCHKTGLVRGIICQKCNVMLGMACDTVENLQAGIDYLLKRR